MPKIYPTKPDLALIDSGEGAWKMSVDLSLSHYDHYLRLMSLLPEGELWDKNPRLAPHAGQDIPEKTFNQILYALAMSFYQADLFGDLLMNEKDPRTASAPDGLLEDWERVTGVPDEYLQAVYEEKYGGDPPLEVRRNDVVTHMASRGGQSIPYFYSLAEKLGYVDENGDPTITITEFEAAYAGEAVCGDFCFSDSWLHVWEVDGVDSKITYFRAGSGRAGDRLAYYEGDPLYGYIIKFKPAHTLAIFTPASLVSNGTFDEDADWTKGANWTISGGKAVRAYNISGSNLTQSITITAGHTYMVEFEITAISS
ncbi:MAG: putative phage tail protein, partial [Planctomycetota bacterium]